MGNTKSSNISPVLEVELRELSELHKHAYSGVEFQTEATFLKVNGLMALLGMCKNVVAFFHISSNA